MSDRRIRRVSRRQQWFRNSALLVGILSPVTLVLAALPIPGKDIVGPIFLVVVALAIPVCIVSGIMSVSASLRARGHHGRP